MNIIELILYFIIGEFAGYGFAAWQEDYSKELDEIMKQLQGSTWKQKGTRKVNNQFFFIRQPGIWMFRIFGYGLQFMTYERSRPYFSERNGYRKPIIKTKKWRIFFLKGNKK